LKLTLATISCLVRKRGRRTAVTLLVIALAALSALATMATAASAETVKSVSSGGAATLADTGQGCFFNGQVYGQGQFVSYPNGNTFICSDDGTGRLVWKAWPGCGNGVKLFYYGQVWIDENGNMWKCEIDQANPNPPRGVWVPVEGGSITSAMRHLQSQNALGLCVGVSGGSQAVGAAIYQESCVSNDHSQSWAQEPVSGDYGLLVNWHSGLCIDVNGSGLLVQSTCDTGVTRMLWRKYATGSSWEFQNDSSGQVITVPGGFTTGPWQLGVYGDLHLGYQKWNILPVNLS
jgi:hypothetical protein